MVAMTAIVILSLFSWTVQGLNLDLCTCGTIQLAPQGFDSMSDLVKAIFPNTASHHYAEIQEALLICNPELRHGLPSLQGVRKQLLEPCLFSGKEFRFFAPEGSGCDCGRVHTVRKRERTWDVSVLNFPSQDALVGVHMMMACNPKLNPYALKEGQNLKMFCFDALEEKQGSAKNNSLSGPAVFFDGKHGEMEQCPTCEIPPFSALKKANESDLHLCGCDDGCGNCAVKYVDGCSSKFPPGEFYVDAPFKEIVTPACNLHDACYSCGDVLFEKKFKTQEERREHCDDLMEAGMIQRCNAIYSADIASRFECRFAAFSYYELAKWFGAQYFVPRCKCSDVWNTYSRNMFLVDHCTAQT